MLISVVTIPVSPNRLVTAPLSLSSLSWAMLLVSGCLTLLAFWWQVLAVYTCTHIHMYTCTHIYLTHCSLLQVPVTPTPSQALYANISILEHSCINNASKHFDGDNRCRINENI